MEGFHQDTSFHISSYNAGYLAGADEFLKLDYLAFEEMHVENMQTPSQDTPSISVSDTFLSPSPFSSLSPLDPGVGISPSFQSISRISPSRCSSHSKLDVIPLNKTQLQCAPCPVAARTSGKASR